MALEVLDIREYGPRKHSSSGSDRSYGTVYLVQVNEKNADPVALRLSLLANPKVPAGWATDPQARISGLDLDQMDQSRFWWTAGVAWSTNFSQQVDEDPLSKPVKRYSTSNPATEYVTQDVYGNPIINTAGDPYDPIEVEALRTEFRVQWNSTSFSVPLAIAYRKATNSDYFSGYDPGTLRVTACNAEEIIIPPGVSTTYPAGLTYYSCEAGFALNTDTWKLKILNSGFYLRDKTKPNDPKKKVRIMTTNDEGVKVPAETRQLISEDGKSVIDNGGTPYIQEFEIRQPLPFSGVFPSL